MNPTLKGRLTGLVVFQGGICAAVVSPRLLFLLVIFIQGLGLAWLPTCSTEAELMAFSAAWIMGCSNAFTNLIN
jgi:hypothetical protein